MWRVVVAGIAAVALSAAGVPSADASSYLTISPGQAFSDVLARAQPGDTVVVNPGSHPDQLIKDMALGGVTVVASSAGAATVGTLTLKNVSGLTLRGLYVWPAASAVNSAIRVYGGSHDIVLDSLDVRPTYNSGIDIFGLAHDVSVTGSLIDGSLASGSTARGVRILGGDDPTTWIQRVTVRANEVRNAWADNVFISGATDTDVVSNFIHDPRQTTDHNDGIQSAGSARLRIVGNVFTGPGSTGPDQAIIVGQSATAATRTVTDTEIVDNVIYDWRGTGIIVAGTTNTLVAGNTVQRTGTSTFRMASLATGEPNGARNPGLTVTGNVFDKIDASLGTIEIQNRNCVRQGGSGADDVTADPELDRETLALSPTSPCRGLAAGTLVRTTDVCGAARDGAPDAGAREQGAPAAGSLVPGVALCSSETAEATQQAGSPVVPPVLVRALVVDGWGGLHQARSCSCSSPVAVRGGPYWPGQDIARGLAVTRAGWGAVLDGWGGLHGFTTDNADAAPALTGPYWPGWDVARGVALLADGSGGYIVDAWGGIHAFAAAGQELPPAPRGGAYWPGWDIARGIVLAPDGSGGFVLDGWGGLHPFGLGSSPGPPAMSGPYWSGWDVVRGASMSPASGAYLVDAWGGLHAAGPSGAPALRGPYWPGWDVARGVAILAG